MYHKLEAFLKQYPKKDKHTHTIYGGGDVLRVQLTQFPKIRLMNFTN